MARLAAVLVVTTLVGCAHAQAPSAAAQPVLDDKLTADVTIAGNRAFRATELRTLVAGIRCDAQHELDITTIRAPQSAPLCNTVDDYAATIEQFYTARGYLAVKTTTTGRSVTVVEGGQFHIGTVEIVEVGPTAKHDQLADPTAIAR